MSYLITPEGYKPLLDLKQTELGIKQIKEFFQLNLSSELRLRRVTAPLFVLKGMGINDDLNGVERAVTFPIKDLGDAKAEVVHSLAKWKRLTLAEYHIEPGYGIYTDMNAIRADEELGNLHSLYVDQWDWERVITAEDRNVEFLKEIVTRIYAAMVRTEYMVYANQALPAPETSLYPCRRIAPTVSGLGTQMPRTCHLQEIRCSVHHRYRMQAERRQEARRTRPGLRRLYQQRAERPPRTER